MEEIRDMNQLMGVRMWVDGVNPGIQLCIVHPDEERGGWGVVQ